MTSAPTVIELVDRLGAIGVPAVFVGWLMLKATPLLRQLVESQIKFSRTVEQQGENMQKTLDGVARVLDEVHKATVRIRRSGSNNQGN